MVSSDLSGFLYTGDIRPAHARCYPGADLGGISVNGLLAAQDQIRNTDSFHGLDKGVGSGPGIGAGKGPVGNKNSGIGTAGNGLPQYLFRLGWPHGQGCHPAALFLLDPDRLFQGMPVKRVHDRGHTFPGHGIGVRIKPDVFGVRHLLYTDDDFHIRYAVWVGSGSLLFRRTLQPAYSLFSS